MMLMDSPRTQDLGKTTGGSEEARVSCVLGSGQVRGAWAVPEDDEGGDVDALQHDDSSDRSNLPSC